MPVQVFQILILAKVRHYFARAILRKRLQFLNKSMTQQQVAAKHGIHIQTVRSYLRDSGVVARSHRVCSHTIPGNSQVIPVVIVSD